MQFLRKALISSLGEERYLALLARTFQKMYRAGALGRDYQDIYFLKNIVRPGAVCVDIGAHLGYFTLELSRLAGPTGHVYAIEPMSKFFQTLQALVRGRNLANVTVEQYAMGAGDEWVEMGIPHVGNVKKFAYARIMRSSAHLEYRESEKVRSIVGDAHFAGLKTIDFIKCDVEGLEYAVMQSFRELVRRFRPVILCELAHPSERRRILDLLGSPYRLYYLHDRQLLPLSPESTVEPISHNHYFIPEA